MGLDIQHLLSESRYYDGLECSICKSLVDLDALVTTSCSHCVCNKCINDSLNLMKTNESTLCCPICNTVLNNENDMDELSISTSTKVMSFTLNNNNKQKIILNIQPLQTCQPIAYRLLHRIQVKCPLRSCGIDCSWDGDYNNLQNHLLSDTAHLEKSEINKIISGDDEKNRDIENISNGNNSSNSNIVDTTDLKSPNVTIDQLKIKILAAKLFKDEANNKFSSGLYTLSQDFYSRGIAILQDKTGDFSSYTSLLQKEAKNLLAILYSNRAAAHLSLKEYILAESDCSKAVNCDREFVKAYVRQAKALIQMGQFQQAVDILHKGIVQIPKSKLLLNKELNNAKTLLINMNLGLQQLDNREFASAKISFGKILIETESVNVLLSAARADLGLGLTDSVSRLTRQVLKEHNSMQATEAYLIRGQCHVFIGNVDEMESGIQLIRQAMRLDPDSKIGRSILLESVQIQNLYKKAKEDINMRQYTSAIENLTKIIDKKDGAMIIPPRAPLFTKLLLERGSLFIRLLEYNKSLKDSATILYHCGDNVDGLLMKYEALHGLERSKEVLEEITLLLKTEQWAKNNVELKKAQRNAQLEVKKQGRPNFYKLLQIPQNATEKEIRKAYRVRALEMHPDRLVSMNYTDEQRKKAQNDFHMLGDSLEYLTDNFKRKLYDAGYDLEYIKERAEANNNTDMRNSAYHYGY